MKKQYTGLQKSVPSLAHGQVVDEDPDKEKEPVEVDQRQEKVKTFFKQIAGDDMEVDWVELKQVLDYAMKQGIYLPLLLWALSVL